MDTDFAETNSTQSSNTVATIQTLANKYDSLHSAMMMLTKSVTKMAETSAIQTNTSTGYTTKILVTSNHWFPKIDPAKPSDKGPLHLRI
jgi:hypothetical protein